MSTCRTGASAQRRHPPQTHLALALGAHVLLDAAHGAQLRVHGGKMVILHEILDQHLPVRVNILHALLARNNGLGQRVLRQLCGQVTEVLLKGARLGS